MKRIGSNLNQALSHYYPVGLVNKWFSVKKARWQRTNVLSEQFLDRPAVRSVWVGEKGCRNSWRKELETNKELYLSHETNHVADMTKKKLLSETFLLKRGEDTVSKSYICLILHN